MTQLVAAVTDALEPRWRLAAGPTRRVRRVVLDSFDWRLHRKGLTAQVVGAPSAPGTLVLAGPDERLEVTLPVAIGDRLRPQDLPDGPLRDRLAGLLDVRVLLPLADVTRSVAALRVLDDLDKTVVRLAVEGDTVVVEPVKGYAGQARAVSAALAAAGLPPSAAADAGALLRAAGHTPGLLPGTVDPVPTPSTPAVVAVAAVLRSFLDQLEANVPGAVADLDPEFVHDLRIAVRRSRSALKLAGDLLPGPQAEHAAAELKWLGDVTTPIRDLDVHLLELPALAGRLEAFTAADLDAFGAHLARHRVGEQRTMARHLTSARYTRFVTSWRAALEALVTPPDGEDAVPVAEVAARRLARADRRVVKLGSAITEESPAEHLHTLRKRAKELRYTVDLFAAVLDPAHAKPLVAELKTLQDVLGAFQDSEVQREALRTVAAAMLAEQTARRPVPVDTLLALGELAGHLAADQADARAHFAERFARFIRPEVRERVAALTGKAAR